ncbi:cortex morphogenetic protein CmpA [Piscibacillus sp. B03]
MPKWFKRQMLNAYANKDIRQIKLLNQCWFFYHSKNLEEVSQE